MTEAQLANIYRVLKQYLWLLIALPLLAIVLVYTFLPASKPQWEAIAVIQIGQIGGNGIPGSVLEPAPRLIERVKLQAFTDGAFSLAGPVANTDPMSRTLFRISLKARSIPNTDYVEIKVRGYSVEDAKKNAQLAVDYIKKGHEELARPTIDRLTQDLNRVNTEIAKLHSDREALIRMAEASAKGVSLERFMGSVFLANILLQRDGEVRNLKQTKALLEEQLGPIKTYPTSQIQAVYVGESPIVSRNALKIVLGALSGLVLGVVVALMLNSVKAEKKKNALKTS